MMQDHDPLLPILLHGLTTPHLQLSKKARKSKYVRIYNHLFTHLITLLCTMIYVYKKNVCIHIHIVYIYIYRTEYLFSANTTFHHLLILCFHFQMGFPRTSMAGIRNAKVFPVPVCLKNPWQPRSIHRIGMGQKNAVNRGY